MSRFILRYRGGGERPAEDLARIRACAGVRVLDDSSPRMMLVEGRRRVLDALLGDLRDWILAEEQEIPRPDPRPGVRKAPGRGED